MPSVLVGAGSACGRGAVRDQRQRGAPSGSRRRPPASSRRAGPHRPGGAPGRCRCRRRRRGRAARRGAPAARPAGRRPPARVRKPRTARVLTGPTSTWRRGRSRQLTTAAGDPLGGDDGAGGRALAPGVRRGLGVDRGVHGAGGDQAHVDARLLAQLELQRADQAELAPLGGDVGAHRGDGDLAEQRVDHDQGAAALARGRPAATARRRGRCRAPRSPRPARTPRPGPARRCRRPSSGRCVITASRRPWRARTRATAAWTCSPSVTSTREQLRLGRTGQRPPRPGPRRRARPGRATSAGERWEPAARRPARSRTCRR